MANTCYTEIEIISENEKQIEEFYEKLKKWTSTLHEYSKGVNTGPLWLGNLVLNAGIAKVAERGVDRSCRGSILEIGKYSSDSIFIETETAWAPLMDIWQDLVAKYIPDARIIYTAEEPGCEIYWSNDPDVESNYCVYTDGEELIVGDEEIGDEYRNISEQKLVELLQRVLQTTEETDVDSLIKLYNCAGYPGLFINKWENALEI